MCVVKAVSVYTSRRGGPEEHRRRTGGGPEVDRRWIGGGPEVGLRWTGGGPEVDQGLTLTFQKFT